MAMNSARFKAPPKEARDEFDEMMDIGKDYTQQQP